MDGSIVLQAIGTVDVPSTVNAVLYIAGGVAAIAGIVVAVYLAIDHFIVQAARDNFDSAIRGWVDENRYLSEQFAIKRIEDAALAKASADLAVQLQKTPTG